MSKRSKVILEVTACILILGIAEYFLFERYSGMELLLNLPDGSTVTKAKNGWGETLLQHRENGQVWNVKGVSTSDLNEKVEKMVFKDGRVEFVIENYRNTKKSQQFTYDPKVHVTRPAP